MTIPTNSYNFSPILWLVIIESQKCSSPKAMQAKVGRLDVNFREITTTTHTFDKSLCLLQKDHWRHSNCKPEKSVVIACLHSIWRCLKPDSQKSSLLPAFRTQKLGLQSVPIINLHFSFVSVEMPLIKHMIAFTTGPILGTHLHHHLLKWVTTV